MTKGKEAWRRFMWNAQFPLSKVKSEFLFLEHGKCRPDLIWQLSYLEYTLLETFCISKPFRSLPIFWLAIQFWKQPSNLKEWYDIVSWIIWMWKYSPQCLCENVNKSFDFAWEASCTKNGQFISSPFEYLSSRDINMRQIFTLLNSCRLLTLICVTILPRAPLTIYLLRWNVSHVTWHTFKKYCLESKTLPAIKTVV